MSESSSKTPSSVGNKARFDSMMRVLIKGDFRTAISGYIFVGPDFKSVQNFLAWYVSAAAVLLMMGLAFLVFLLQGAHVSLIYIVAVIGAVAFLFLLLPVVRVLYWSRKEPQKVLSLVNDVDPSFSRRKRLWEEVFMVAGLVPVVAKYENDYGFIMHDNKKQLFVEVRTRGRIEVSLFRENTAFTETNFQVAFGWHDKEPESFLEELLSHFDEVPAGYQFMILRYGVAGVEIIREGAQIGVPPRTLATLIDHEIPVKRWDDLKDYPAEWVVGVV